MNKHIYSLIFSFLFCITAHSAENNHELTFFEHKNEDKSTNVRKVKWNADGSRLTSIDSAGTVRSWNVETNAILKETPGNKCDVVAYNPTDPNVIAWSRKRDVYMRDTRSRESSDLFSISEKISDSYLDLRNFCWDPTGTKLLTALSCGTLGLHNLMNGSALYYKDSSNTKPITWGEQGILCGTSGSKRGNSVYLMEVAGGEFKEKERFDTNDHDPRAIAWRPNGSQEFAVGNGKEGSNISTVNIMTTDGTVKTLFDMVQMQATSIAWHPTENLLTTGSKSNTWRYKDAHVYIWDTNKEQAVERLPGHQDVINDVAFSPDGNTIASASEDGTVRLWRTPDTALAAAATAGENSDE